MRLRGKLTAAISGGILMCALPGTHLVGHAQELPVGGDVIAFVGHTTALNCGNVGEDSDSDSVIFDTLIDGTVGDDAVNTCPAGGGGVPVAGGEGTYTFATDVCAYVSDPSVQDGLNEVGTCNFTSTGTYENLVCGTGEADGNAGQTVINTSGDGSASAVYHIDFVAGVGVVTGTATETDVDGQNPATLAGLTVLLPPTPTIPPTLPPTGVCVTGFNVVGVAALVD